MSTGVVYGIELINGVAFVQAYNSPKDVPKNHIMKYPNELRDYLDKLAEGE